MKKASKYLPILIFSIGTTGISASAFDFSCEETRQLTEMLARGPDYVVRKFSRNPQRFSTTQITGWACVVDPIPPTRNNRVYLEAIQCFRSDRKVPVNSEDVKAAGQIYKKNVGTLIRCFPDSIGSMSKTYNDGSPGEALWLSSDEFVDGADGTEYHIFVEYGYWQTGDSPMFWETSVRIGSPRLAE